MNAERDPDAIRRARIESELTAEEAALIHELARALYMPADVWPALPPFRSFVLLAVFRRARRYEAEGLSNERATIRAAAELGLDGETLLRQRRRWRAALCKADKMSGRFAATGGIVKA